MFSLIITLLAILQEAGIVLCLAWFKYSQYRSLLDGFVGLGEGVAMLVALWAVGILLVQGFLRFEKKRGNRRKA